MEGSASQGSQDAGMSDQSFMQSSAPSFFLINLGSALTILLGLLRFANYSSDLD